MSRANLALAHEVIDAVERRDLDALIELTDPGVEWRSAFVAGTGGVTADTPVCASTSAT